MESINDLTNEQAGELIQEMIDQDPMVAALQEVFIRLNTLENVLVDIISIVSANVDQPMTMATELRALLTPPPEDPETYDAPPNPDDAPSES